MPTVAPRLACPARSSPAQRPRWRPWPLALLLVLIPCLLLACGYWKGPRSEPTYKQRVAALTADRQFDFVRWEVTALVESARARVTLSAPDPAGEESRDRVLAYVERAGAIQRLRDQAEADASLARDAEGRTGDLAQIEWQLAALRAEQELERAAVQRILESQVSAVLRDEGLGWLGTAMPPPLFSFSEPPAYLVVSPRDQILTRTGVYLDPVLSVAEREEIEASVEAIDANTSALITDTGGFSTWPTMLVDWAGIEWTLATIAHEWTHVYLMPYPLGWHYYDNSDTTAINETVADLVGDEVGRMALQRFYPEQAPAGVERTRTASASDTSAFDFATEMRATRQQVDALLEAGQVEEAESYMEARRQLFVANGHYIRKLNQAYFAFHGSYRTGAEAPSDDPIAPRLQRLRQDSADLAAFLASARCLSGLDDLLTLVPSP